MPVSHAGDDGSIPSRTTFYLIGEMAIWIVDLFAWHVFVSRWPRRVVLSPQEPGLSPIGSVNQQTQLHFRLKRAARPTGRHWVCNLEIGVRFSGGPLNS